jgi:subtilisin family serine protease
MQALSERGLTLNRARGGVLALAALAFALLVVGSVSAARTAQSEYIVVLKASAGPAADVARQHARDYGGTLDFVYSHALKGYAMKLSAAAADKIAKLSVVSEVEADSVYTIDTTQSPATWGIDRIDQRNLPLSNSYTYTNTGAGVTAYIIDTGIRMTHTQFGGRAVFGFDAITPSTNGVDCNGHGTHVSGTVGGSTYGVAKSVKLVAVRVLNCQGSGTNAQVISGIDWATGNHQAGQPAVANMSLGGSASTALDNAVRNSIADGIAYSVSAGNGNILGVAVKACRQSPARVPEAMTISATDNTDTKPVWANIGTCVDWFAPGVNVTSAWNTNDNATNTISGTSMASPHNTGVAALYLQTHPSSTPAQVAAALGGNTTNGVVKSPGKNTPNKLLFTDY